jgi:hypothetical protein
MGVSVTHRPKRKGGIEKPKNCLVKNPQANGCRRSEIRSIQS